MQTVDYKGKKGKGKIDAILVLRHQGERISLY
jgi:hypothetical protein